MRANHVKMVSMAATSPGALPWKSQRQIGKQPLIVTSQFPTTCIPLLQVAQLYSKDCCLQFVQSAVYSGHGADLSFSPSVFAELAHSPGELCVIRNYSTAIAD